MEGVFSFGGENQQGVLNNNLTFINVLGKGGQNLDIKFKRWELVNTNDDKPCPRKDHSFNIINKKGIAVLVGGTDQQGTWLTDVWLFDFVRLTWGRVSTSPAIFESIGQFHLNIDRWQVTVLVHWAPQCICTTETWTRRGRRRFGVCKQTQRFTNQRRRYTQQNCHHLRVSCRTRRTCRSQKYD